MASERFPIEWPPIIIREFNDISKAYIVLRDIVRSLNDLRRRILLVGENHSNLIDFAISATNSITSGTTQTQAGATALTSRFNRVDGHANTDDGVKLPTAVEGREVIILNDSATADLQVWPATDDAIEAGAANAVGVTKLSNAVAGTYIAIDATTWHIINRHTTP